MQIPGTEMRLIIVSLYPLYDQVQLPTTADLIQLANYSHKNKFPIIISGDVYVHNIIWCSTDTNATT